MTAGFDRARFTAEGRASPREDERRRLARDLHDGPAQALSAALFGVDLAVGALDRSPDLARGELLAARELVRDALDDVRALIVGLRPRLLEERGLVAALRALAANPPMWGPTVRVDVCGIERDGRLAPDVELAIFRIAQEAVSNARRHSAASSVLLRLAIDRTSIALTVADDGCGFRPDHAMAAAGRGEGLPGMRERASLLGGEFAITSTPGAGTRVAVTIPLLADETGLGEGEA